MSFYEDKWKCVSCEKPIDPDEDDHAECDKCNGLICNDNNSCIRDHFEWDHNMGYTNRSPKTERRMMKEQMKGITPEFIIMEDKVE